jgi:hypothetical protein
MFPKKKPAFGAKPGIPAMKPKPPMDELESPDPVEGKDDPPDPDEASESDDGSGSFEASIDAAGEAMGMDSATSRAAASAFFKAALECLGGGDEAEAEAPEISGGERYGR